MLPAAGAGFQAEAAAAAPPAPPHHQQQQEQPAGAVPPPKDPVSLDLFAVVNEVRSSHGMRHQDYQRCREHLTGRLRRLRKQLGLHDQTRGKNFKRRILRKEDVADARALQLLLFQAERAWTYAMELKDENRTEGDPHRQYHVVRRFRKAAVYASQLESLCGLGDDARVDTRTSLETQAYSAVLSGYAFFEEKKWLEALEKFTCARTIYEKLAATGTPHQEALCHAAVDEIDPNIRYCAYNLRVFTGGGDVSQLMATLKKKGVGSQGLQELVLQLDDVLGDQLKAKEGEVVSVAWRGSHVSIKSADLAVHILKVAQLSKEVSKEISRTSGNQPGDALEGYDKLLSAYSDAENASRKVVEADRIATAKVQSTKSQQQTRDLHASLAYLVYNRTVATVKRNLIMVGQAKSAIEEGERGGHVDPTQYMAVVRLFDVIIQAIMELSKLPGGDEDVELQDAIVASAAYYRAWRTVYVAAAYMNQGKVAEVLALLDRAQEYLRRSQEAVYTGYDDAILPPKQDVESVELAISTRKALLRASWTLSTSGNSETRRGPSQDDHLPLICRLESFPTSLVSSSTSAAAPPPCKPAQAGPPGQQLNLIEAPPRFVPVPAHPVLFDLAFGMIDVPEARLAELEGTASEPKSSGGVGRGLFGGWFGAK